MLFLIQFNVPFKIISLIEMSQSIGGAKREYVTYEKYGGPYLPYVCQDGRGLMTGLWDFLSKFGQTHKQEKS